MLLQQHYIIPAAETPTAESEGMMSSPIRGRRAHGLWHHVFRINYAALVCSDLDVKAKLKHRGLDSLGGQRVDVPDLSGHGHGVSIDDIEVLLPKQQQTLAGVQTLHPGTAVHVLNLQQ